MFYALATNDATVNAKVDRAIMLAPCLYLTEQTADGKAKDFTMEGYETSIDVFDKENVNLFSGPNAADDKKKLCTGAEGYEVACAAASMFEQFKTLPVKSLKQFNQVAISNRFQQYVEDFNEDTKT